MKQSSKFFKFVCLLLVVGLLFAALPTGQAQAAVLCVAPGGVGGCHATIQAAVDAAGSGDTITIAAGTYDENVVISHKTSLTIQGVGDDTLIQGDGIGFRIHSSGGITIKDLKIHTVGVGNHGINVDGAALGGERSWSLTVQNTTIVTEATGIIGDSVADGVNSYWLITNNRITAADGGIGLQDVDNSTISNNTITIPDGTNIYWTSERYNLVNLVLSGNTVSGSGGSQVSVMTDWNELGTAVPIESPVAQTTITGVTISGNTFSNWGSRAIRVGDGSGGTATGTITGIVINGNTFNMTADLDVIGGTDAPFATGSGNIFNVSGTAKIQDAVDAAFSGDTINVAAGTYYESQILIDKPLTLQGAGYATTIIDGGGTGTLGLVKITASGTVTLSGFTIQNTETNDDFGYGVYVNNVTATVNILDNAIKSFGPVGIYVHTATSVHIERNIISAPHIISDPVVVPNGIQIGYLDGGSSPSLGITGTIVDNEIRDCSWIGYNVATDNYESNTTGAGILIMDTAADLEISNNVIHNNNVGIDIEAGALTNIVNNDIHDNAYGVVSYNANPSINTNKIVNNSTSGVYRTSFGDPSGTLDATPNWWGSATGPTHVSNSGGLGDAISDDVDFTPWCGDAACSFLVSANPVAVDQSVTTAEDTAAIITLGDTTDLDGHALTYFLMSQPAHGTAVLLGNVVTYTPELNYNGTDSFTFKANNTIVDSNVATVTISVTPVKDDPMAVDDAYQTNQDTLLDVSVVDGVLKNDTDVDLNNMAATLQIGPTHGALNLLGDGSFTYMPNPGWFGTDTFVYELVTYPAANAVNAGWTDTATVTITVHDVVEPVFYLYLPLILK